jgi:outer membrane protein TolC
MVSLAIGTIFIFSLRADTPPAAAPTSAPPVVPAPMATATPAPDTAPAEEAEPPRPEQQELNTNPDALTLDEALRIAYQKSPLILEAGDAVKQASGFTVETRAAAMPQLLLNANAAQADSYRTANTGGESYDLVNVPTTQFRGQPSGPQWTVQLKLVKTIFDGQEIRNRIGAAKVSQAMASYSMEDVIQQVRLQVCIQFYQALYQQQRVQIYKDSIGLLGKQAGRVQNQVQFGGSNEFNLLRAEGGVDSLEPQELQAESEYQTALQQLATLIGMDYAEAERRIFGPGLRGKLPEKADIPSLDEALQKSTNNRPLIHKLEMAVEAERLDMRAEAAAYYPKISLFGAVGHSDEPTAAGASEPNNNNGYIVGVAATWNVFDGGLVQGHVQMAKAQFSNAIHALEAAREASQFDVRQALKNLAYYQRDVDAHRDSLERSRKCDNIAVDRAASGTGTIYELIQTLQITTVTRSELLNQLYQLGALQAQIDYLTGKGVEVERVEP